MIAATPGKTNQEIGNELCISTATVKAYLIGLKLRAHNRAQIAYAAAKRRMLTMSRDVR